MKSIPTAVLAGLVACACGAEPSGDRTDAPSATLQGARGFEPPVVTNAESPVRYPPDLYEQRVEGTVVLRLYITASGNIVPDSTRVSETSGHAALDSAAVGGVTQMQFAPARRDGEPVAATFLQPIHFRHPDGPAAGGSR